MSAPILTILAGSNGSGKSTLTSSAKEEFQQWPVLDPDAFAKSIRDSVELGVSDIEAGRQVLLQAEKLLNDHQSFTVETTLSGTTYLRMAEKAKRLGFLLCVIFVGTASVEINIERVKARVIKGGHDVPEHDQRRRYPRTLANAAKLLRSADFVVLLDNSSSLGYRLVGTGSSDGMRWVEPVPDWARALRGV